MTGERLKFELRRRGYTIRRLADYLGTSAQNVSRKLTADDVSTALLEQAAAMMQLSPAELYGATGDTIQATAARAIAFKGVNNAADPRLLDIMAQQQQLLAATQQQLSDMHRLLSDMQQQQSAMQQQQSAMQQQQSTLQQQQSVLQQQLTAMQQCQADTP